MISKGLKALEERNIPLTSHWFRYKLRPEDTASLIRAVGHVVNGRQFNSAIETEFTTLKLALKHFEITVPDALKPPRKISSAKMALYLLLELDHLGIPINVGNFKKDPDGLVARYLQEFFEDSGLKGSHLVAAVYYYFDGWDEALEQLRMIPTQVRRRNHLRRTIIVRAIRALYHGNIRINRQSLNSDDSTRTLEIIESVTQFPISAGALIQQGISTFGSYDLLIANSGIDPRTITTKRIHAKIPIEQQANDVFSLSHREIIEGLYACYRAEVHLYPSALRNDLSDHTRAVLFSAIGKNIPGAVFYQRARDLGISYKKILESASIDSQAIWLMRFKPFQCQNALTTAGTPRTKI